MDLADAVGHPAFPSTLESLIRHHAGTVLDIARESLEREDVLDFAVPNARPLAPVIPSSIHSFHAFGGPGRGAPGRASPFSASEMGTVLGPDETVPWPRFTAAIDFEGQWACLVGGPGRNLSVSRASSHIFGYVLMIQWMGRDPEPEEAADETAPGRSQRAAALGPWVVTADEVDTTAVELTVAVDDEPWGQAASSDMRCGFSELLACASLDRDVAPGDLLASGPFPGGRGRDGGRLPGPGSTVSLEGTGFGVLRTRIGPRPAGPPPTG